MVQLGLVNLHDGENVELGHCRPERFNDLSNAGFLGLGTTDILGRIILCHQGAVWCLVGCLAGSPVSTH